MIQMPFTEFSVEISQISKNILYFNYLYHTLRFFCFLLLQKGFETDDSVNG